MKDQDNWKPSKFILKNQRWIPNPSYPGISVHSFIVASNQIEYYQRYIKDYCKGYLLDCGCGDVPYFGIYKDSITDVYCIDWENTGTQQLHIDQFANLNEPIQIDSERFDSILLSDVLEHIAEPEQLIKELNRLLKPGGNLVIMVPFLYRLHEEPFDYYRYTEHALRHIVEKAGFRIVKIDSYGGIVDVIFDMLNKGFFNSKKRSNLLFKIYSFVKRIGYFKRINESRRLTFPLGYCVAVEKI